MNPFEQLLELREFLKDEIAEFYSSGSEWDDFQPSDIARSIEAEDFINPCLFFVHGVMAFLPTPELALWITLEFFNVHRGNIFSDYSYIFEEMFIFTHDRRIEQFYLTHSIPVIKEAYIQCKKISDICWPVEWGDNLYKAYFVDIYDPNFRESHECWVRRMFDAQ